MAAGYHFEIRGMPDGYKSNRLRGGVNEWLRQLLGADTHLEARETRMYKRSCVIELRIKGSKAASKSLPEADIVALCEAICDPAKIQHSKSLTKWSLLGIWPSCPKTDKAFRRSITKVAFTNPHGLEFLEDDIAKKDLRLLPPWFAPLSFSLLTGIQICSLDMVGRAYEEAPRERRTKIGAFLKLLWAKNMTTMLVNMSSVVAGSYLDDLIWKMAEDTRLLIDLNTVTTEAQIDEWLRRTKHHLSVAFDAMVVVVWQDKDTLHGLIEIVDPPDVGGTDTGARPSRVDRIIAVLLQNNDSETEAHKVYERAKFLELVCRMYRELWFFRQWIADVSKGKRPQAAYLEKKDDALAAWLAFVRDRVDYRRRNKKPNPSRVISNVAQGCKFAEPDDILLYMRMYLEREVHVVVSRAKKIEDSVRAAAVDSAEESD